MDKHQFKILRKKIGLSQEKLGEAIGRTRIQIIRYEMGQAEIPTIAVLALDSLVRKHEEAA